MRWSTQHFNILPGARLLCSTSRRPGPNSRSNAQPLVLKCSNAQMPFLEDKFLASVNHCSCSKDRNIFMTLEKRLKPLLSEPFAPKGEILSLKTSWTAKTQEKSPREFKDKTISNAPTLGPCTQSHVWGKSPPPLGVCWSFEMIDTLAHFVSNSKFEKRAVLLTFSWQWPDSFIPKLGV